MRADNIVGMIRNQTIQALLGVSALMLAVIFVPRMVSADAPQQCFGDWVKAAAIVQQNKMIDVAGLEALARAKFDGKIMAARLCKGDGIYFYRLVIQRGDGRVQRVKVDAAKPLQ